MLADLSKNRTLLILLGLLILLPLLLLSIGQRQLLRPSAAGVTPTISPCLTEPDLCITPSPTAIPPTSTPTPISSCTVTLTDPIITSLGSSVNINAVVTSANINLVNYVRFNTAGSPFFTVSPLTDTTGIPIPTTSAVYSTTLTAISPGTGLLTALVYLSNSPACQISATVNIAVTPTPSPTPAPPACLPEGSSCNPISLVNPCCKGFYCSPQTSTCIPQFSTPTPTLVPPSGTPPPPPGLSFLIRFEGVTPLSPKNPKTVNLVFTPYVCPPGIVCTATPYTIVTNPFDTPSNSEVRYIGTIPNPPPPGQYLVSVKGPLHLRHNFGLQDTTKTPLDLASFALLRGDVWPAGGDNTLQLNDITAIISAWFNPPVANPSFDLTDDGVVSQADLDAAVQNWTSYIVTGDSP